MRSRAIDFKPSDRRMCVLRMRGKLKIVSSSVPMLQWRKGVKEKTTNFMSN
jgi:hypothetical protein